MIMKVMAMMKFSKIKLDKNNRMLRIGFGKNKGDWFIRIDLWWLGLRMKKESAILA